MTDEIQIEKNTKLVTNIGVAIAFGMAMVASGKWLSDAQNKILNDIASLRKEVTALELSVAKELKEIRADLEVSRRSPELFLRVDMRDWCEQAEKQNNGFICPNPYDTPRYRRLLESQ